MEELQIELNTQIRVYFPGQVVEGTVCLRLREPYRARAVVVSMHGKAFTQWTVWERHNANRGSHHQEVKYSAEMVYTDQQSVIWQPSPGAQSIPVGEQRFPFSFVLPTTCPPTFEGESGFIRYYLKVKTDRPWLPDKIYRLPFTVTPHFVLNCVPYAALPMIKQFSQELRFLWFQYGQIDCKMSLSKCGYVPGESLLLVLHVDNKSTKDVIRIESCLVQNSIYTGQRQDHILSQTMSKQYKVTENREESRIVVQYVERFCVPKHSVARYQRLLAIPPIVPSFNLCSVVQVNYCLKVKVVTKSLGRNVLLGKLPILIGTEPVRALAVPSSKSIETVMCPLVPPKPSITPKLKNSQVCFADCLFGMCELEETGVEHMPNYTPQYIYYSSVS